MIGAFCADGVHVESAVLTSLMSSVAICFASNEAYGEAINTAALKSLQYHAEPFPCPPW